MSKLDDILRGDEFTGYPDGMEFGDTEAEFISAKQKIKELFLELIGADVSTYSDPDDTKPNKYLQAENRLRRELRKKVEEL